MREITVSAITKELKEIRDLNGFDAFIAKYAADNRDSVVKLVFKASKQKEALMAEFARTEEMKKYEKQYSDYEFICGIDEVGRGPLAGPVYGDSSQRLRYPVSERFQEINGGQEGRVI